MGPLDGLRVVELSHEHVAWAGKLLSDLGAEVVVVEPPGGSPQRSHGPFLEDRPGPERSLWWWNYNTGKRSVVADLTSDAPTLGELIGNSDILLEAEAPGRLADHGLDWERLSARNPRLIMVSVTPFGQASPRSGEPVTDLTLMAESGPVWSCGYDDHSLPPVRGQGNQALQAAGNWAAIAILVALLHRDRSGRGQHVDVSMSASLNLTTEMAGYGWLAAGVEVQRQTGRHAAPVPTPTTQVRCRDGRYATTGVLPREPAAFGRLVNLLDRLELREEFPEIVILDMAAARESLNLADIANDPLLAEMFTTARDALRFLAERMDAYDFFYETQKMGLATGAIYTPGEAMRDPNVVARGFPTPVEHEDLGRTFMYPGPPYRFDRTPWSTSRAPGLGEHQDLLGP